MAGPAVAAAILSVASWPWLFALNLPLGLLTLWMGRRALPHNPTREGAAPEFSLIDVALNVLMFTLVFIGADYLGVRSGAAHSAPALGWALLAAGVAVGLVYLRRQSRLTAPLFPLDLLRMPVFALSMGSSLGAFCAQMLAFLSLPFLLLEVQGRSHMDAGLIMTAWPLVIVISPMTTAPRAMAMVWARISPSMRAALWISSLPSSVRLPFSSPAITALPAVTGPVQRAFSAFTNAA